MKAAAFIALALTAVSAAPAAACSISYPPGLLPAEIRERDDVRRVRGTFRFVEGRIENDRDGRPARSVILGRIESADGQIWQTTQLYSEILLECAALHTPGGDAVGTFWMLRDRVRGRHTLLLWDGRYLPRPDSQIERTQ